MPDFRLKAVSTNDKFITKEFEATSKREARKRVDSIAQSQGFDVKTIDKKTTFIYKVQRGQKKPVTGEQKAYSKREVEEALVKMGYKVISINKKWFELKWRIPKKEVVTFIRLSADLLRQQLDFNEILTLLYEDTQNKRLQEVIKEIQQDLKEGKEGTEVYGKHKGIFGKFAAYMLGVASTSGNMAQVFESTAKFMERDMEFKKNLRRSLLMPGIMVVAVIGVVLFYVGYIFPAMAEMFLKFNIKLPPMTAATLQLSHWLQAHWLLLFIAFFSPIILFAWFIRTPGGRLWLDRNIIKLPVLGDLLHKTSIEIFSRVFYTLYSGSGQNIKVIRIAAEACRNTYMEKQIKEVAITMMLREGTGLIEALESTGVFTHTAISRFKLGMESGALRENAKQLASYYEIQTTYKMETAIDMIKLGVNLFITLAVIAITIVSSEAALIQPQSNAF
jgi:type IV pilus assembly protein PilC